MRGEGEICGISANEYSCTQEPKINFGDLTPYLTYGLYLLGGLQKPGITGALLMDSEKGPVKIYVVYDFGHRPGNGRKNCGKI
jgi:hypothetical protein